MKHQRYHNLLKAIEEERKNEEAYYRELSKSATSKDKIESGILWYPVDIVKQRYTIGEFVEIGEGTVIVSDWNPQTGYVLGIQHSEDFISFYKHCSVLLKNVGELICCEIRLADAFILCQINGFC